MKEAVGQVVVMVNSGQMNEQCRRRGVDPHLGTSLYIFASSIFPFEHERGGVTCCVFLFLYLLLPLLEMAVVRRIHGCCWPVAIIELDLALLIGHRRTSTSSIFLDRYDMINLIGFIFDR